VHLTGWAETPFNAQYERLRADPDWEVITIDCGHNVMAERPDEPRRRSSPLEAPPVI
jgi:hypothetical protein